MIYGQPACHLGSGATKLWCTYGDLDLVDKLYSPQVHMNHTDIISEEVTDAIKIPKKGWENFQYQIKILIYFQHPEIFSCFPSCLLQQETSFDGKTRQQQRIHSFVQFFLCVRKPPGQRNPAKNLWATHGMFWKQLFARERSAFMFVSSQNARLKSNLSGRVDRWFDFSCGSPFFEETMQDEHFWVQKGTHGNKFGLSSNKQRQDELKTFSSDKQRQDQLKTCSSDIHQRRWNCASECACRGWKENLPARELPCLEKDSYVKPCNLVLASADWPQFSSEWIFSTWLCIWITSAHVVLDHSQFPSLLRVFGPLWRQMLWHPKPSPLCTIDICTQKDSGKHFCTYKSMQMNALWRGRNWGSHVMLWPFPT